jgi:DNA-binding transcriptional MerR regulator
MPNDGTAYRPRLSIGEAAELTGLTPHTLRYYERVGILNGQVERAGNGHRVYGEPAVRRLLICKRLRAAGMPLHGVRSYVENLAPDEDSERARLEVLHAHRARLGNEIAELRAMPGDIELKVAAHADDPMAAIDAVHHCVPT